MEAAPSPGWMIARQSARFVLRERTVALLSLMFVVLVLVSAWLGWSATATVNAIYADAAKFLAAKDSIAIPEATRQIDDALKLFDLFDGLDLSLRTEANRATLTLRLRTSVPVE